MSPRIAIVVSRFNEEITAGLLRGASSYLDEQGIALGDDDIIRAPGAFELPLIAQSILRARRHDGVICLGCVIKGDTAHFEFISLGATIGVMMASLATETPISFGILTAYSEEQAVLRSQDDEVNKGREAARACLDCVQILRQIRLSHATDAMA